MERIETKGHQELTRSVSTLITVVSVLRGGVHMLLSVGTACRFIPCCSAYAKDCFRTQSLGKSLILIMVRLLRCHPFTAGGYDPVPVKGNHHGL